MEVDRPSASTVDTIVARQRKILRAAFWDVNPIDEIQVDREMRGYRVCARDLALAAGVARPESTRYSVQAYGYDGSKLDFARELPAAPSGELCARGLTPAPDRNDGYVMLVYVTYRGPIALPSVIVHFARNPLTSALRVVGIERS